MIKKIGHDNIQALVKALMAQGSVFAPVKCGNAANFAEICSSDEVTLDFYNTIQSPKGVLFPQADDMISYKVEREGTTSEEVCVDETRRIILGVRPCDVKSFEIMDRLFTGGGVTDPYWDVRRKNTLIIGYAFESVDSVDFFGSFNIHAADPEGSDVFMVRREGEFLLKGITEKGTILLESLNELQDGTKGDEKLFDDITDKGRNMNTRVLETDGLVEKLEGLFDDPYWEKVAASCLNCGVCTYVCPTCHCFDIQDETIFGEGKRKKIWDSCMFNDFTLHASGHNPRTRKSQRLRQRVFHKFSYYVTNFDVFSCVGCGRCTRFCPVNIDIVTIVEGAVRKAQ